MEKIKLKYIFFFLPLLLVGCTAINKLATRNPKYLNWEQTVNLSPKFNRMEWRNAKVDIEFGSQKFSSPIQAKIIPDSAIHLSATPFFGMEMFKVELEKTKINLYDKVNKKIYEVDFNLTDSLTGNSFVYDNLQDVFSNKPFIYAPNPIHKMKKSIRNDSVFWILERNASTQTISLDRNGRMIATTIKSNQADREIKIEYSKFEKWDSKLFPEIMDLTIRHKALKIKLSLSLKKIIFDNQLNMRYEKPENYLRVPISTLL